MNKYNNKKYTDKNGNIYDSKLEYDYAEYLNRNNIDYSRQQKYILQDSFVNGNGKKIRELSYIADFVFFTADGKIHIVDCKGMLTDVYKLKKKLFECKYYPLVIEEIKRGDFKNE